MKDGQTHKTMQDRPTSDQHETQTLKIHISTYTQTTNWDTCRYKFYWHMQGGVMLEYVSWLTVFKLDDRFLIKLPTVTNYFLTIQKQSKSDTEYTEYPYRSICTNVKRDFQYVCRVKTLYLKLYWLI